MRGKKKDLALSRDRFQQLRTYAATHLRSCRAPEAVMRCPRNHQHWNLSYRTGVKHVALLRVMEEEVAPMASVE